jgi:hypothetical protein
MSLTIRYKVASLLMITTAIATFLLPFPQKLVSPGFSSLILLNDYPFSILFLVTLVLLGFVWYGAENSRLMAFVSSLVFSLLIMDVWLKAPYGYLLGGYSFSAYVFDVLQTGHSTLFGISWPGYYLIASVLILFNSSSVLSLTLFDILRTLLYVLFSFLIIQRYIQSYRLAALGVMLSVVADFFICTSPMFDIVSFGWALFPMEVFVTLTLIDRFSFKRNVVFAILMAGLAVSYPGAPPVLILIISFALVTKLLDRRFIHAPAMGKLLMSLFLLIALSGAFSSYLSTQGTRIVLDSAEYGLTNAFQVITGTIKQNSTSGGAGYGYLFQLLSSRLNSLPLWISALLPGWFIVLYVAGTVASFVDRSKKRETKFPESYVVIPILLSGAILFSFNGGAEWIRVLPFIGPFLATTVMLNLKRHPRFLYPAAVVSILILALPTVVAYYPEVGTFGANFPVQVNAGIFVQHHFPNGTIYLGDGLVFSNSGFLSRIILGSWVGTAKTELSVLQNVLSQFSGQNSDSILTFSPLFARTFMVLYGVNSDEVSNLVMHSTNASQLVYSNGFTEIFAR